MGPVLLLIEIIMRTYLLTFHSIGNGLQFPKYQILI